MDKKILIVVDMQYDFIDGSLGTPKAQEIVPAVVEKIRNFNGKIFVTQDTHGSDYLETQEGKHLPIPHCEIYTHGWEIEESIDQALFEHELSYFNVKKISKSGFGSKKIAKYLAKNKDKISSIEIVGLCTDICVITNALLAKTYCPNAKIIVDSECCAGTTPEKHQMALEVMKSCQIEIC